MEHPSSLLRLTDACLIKIFSFLEVAEFVNLAKVCRRLRNLADTVDVCQITDITIYVECSDSYEEVKRSEEEFSDKLSVIGIHLLSICIEKGNDFIFETINNNCKNLSSFKLHNANPLSELRDLSDAKGLIIRDYQKLFTNNPNIESIELNYGTVYIPESYIQQLISSLRMLKKLKSLELHFQIPYVITERVLLLPMASTLTKLSFRCDNNCNKFLIELATTMNLLELHCFVDINDGTFATLSLFRILEVLCITNRYYYLSKKVVLPATLKRIDFSLITMKWKTFVSIVERLKYLEEFQLRCDDILDG